ncbi:MAG: tRNA 2-selenouridine(34) synthase MnmH [Alphaproteobacteria bacterium RIFCSPHIGHO2_12_FULL_63_12]|nr:MAG: tRNA 2-selenouridine(34) synthase MnmH [Alphaproteobacteria bacterium RIFCSPHIGHO2_12_FULL_63_12]
MIETLPDIALPTLAPFDAIIDVRSPAEFAEDHIPGAINLPVLSNEERAEVGTIYVQDSRFRARRIGAAHVARNVARHLETALADRDAKFRPLLYCWRGGMRSNAMATILLQIGWRAGVLAGGYKTWRRAVVAALFDDPSAIDLVLIDGETGAAKTEILRRMATLGVQTIDLEGLAAHKGSVFGADMARPQPSQKMFESLLFNELRRFDAATPIVVEAESSKIGRLNIPKRFWMSMRAAPRLTIRADAAARAAYSVRNYADFIQAPGEVDRAIERLRPFHPKETIDEMLALSAAGSHAALAEKLMRDHYDPLYQRSQARRETKSVGVVALENLDSDDLSRAARAAAALIAASSRR